MLPTLKIIFPSTFCQPVRRAFLSSFFLLSRNNDFHGKIPKLTITMIIVMNDTETNQQLFMFIDWRQRKKKGNEAERETWLVSLFLSTRFSLSTSVVEEISSVKLRELFSFLSGDDIEGLAKQSVKNQLEPQLLNSYQGHLKSITSLIYHERNQVLISSSRDKTVRLWNLSGQVFVVCDFIGKSFHSLLRSISAR